LGAVDRAAVILRRAARGAAGAPVRNSTSGTRVRRRGRRFDASDPVFADLRCANGDPDLQAMKTRYFALARGNIVRHTD